MPPCNFPFYLMPQNTNTLPPFQGRERVSLDDALAVPPWLPRVLQGHSVNGRHHCALDNGRQLPARLSSSCLTSFSAREQPGSAGSSGGIFSAIFAIRLSPSRTRLGVCPRLLVSINAFVLMLCTHYATGVTGCQGRVNRAYASRRFQGRAVILNGFCGQITEQHITVKDLVMLHSWR